MRGEQALLQPFTVTTEMVGFTLIQFYTRKNSQINHFVFKYKEIVASYSDDDIYLFDTEQEQDKDAKCSFKGHRNTETSK